MVICIDVADVVSSFISVVTSEALDVAVVAISATGPLTLVM